MLLQFAARVIGKNRGTVDVGKLATGGICSVSSGNMLVMNVVCGKC